jgi:hypothetical protein
MPRIRTFTGPYVCFFRRNKKTYYVLQWNNNVRKWLRSQPELPDLTLHRSNLTRDAEVSINVATYGGAPAKLVPVTADGFYIKSGDFCIPILKARNSLPQAFMMTEYTALDTPFTQTDELLWSLDAAVAAPVYAAQPPPLAIAQEKLPKRIAWLIAEDASKSGETCPISTNDISPITASVTTCYHVFETEAITEWIARHPINTPCPVCRKPCEVTVAYAEAQ